MKQITLDEALERRKSFQALDEAVEKLKALDNVGSIEKSRAFVSKDVTFAEALQMLMNGGRVYYDDGIEWVRLTISSNTPFNTLLNKKFKAEVQARSISFTMTQRHPIASKRNAFEFQNEVLDISIYGKKGTIPNSGKGIRVQITEIL